MLASDPWGRRELAPLASRAKTLVYCPLQWPQLPLLLGLLPLHLLLIQADGGAVRLERDACELQPPCQREALRPVLPPVRGAPSRLATSAEVPKLPRLSHGARLADVLQAYSLLAAMAAASRAPHVRATAPEVVPLD